MIVTDRSFSHGTVDYDSLNPDIKIRLKIKYVPVGGISTSADLENVVS